MLLKIKIFRKDFTNLNILLIIIINILQIKSIMIVLQINKEYCVIKEIKFLDVINFSYMVSGEREDLINIKFFKEKINKKF